MTMLISEITFFNGKKSCWNSTLMRTNKHIKEYECTSTRANGDLKWELPPCLKHRLHHRMTGVLRDKAARRLPLVLLKSCKFMCTSWLFTIQVKGHFYATCVNIMNNICSREQHVNLKEKESPIKYLGNILVVFEDRFQIKQLVHTRKQTCD